jgi:nucleotide-binding universal stress UspA family protein
MLPFKTILFTTDFSPASGVAWEVAGALARDYRSRVIVAHVLEPTAVGFNEFAPYAGHEEDRAAALANLQSIQAPSPRVALEYRLLEGDPAQAINEAAAEIGADLIVMGTHGRTGLSRLLMGSVAEEVLRTAPCPVMTIRGSIKVRAEQPAEEMPETAML